MVVEVVRVELVPHPEKVKLDKTKLDKTTINVPQRTGMFRKAAATARITTSGNWLPMQEFRIGAAKRITVRAGSQTMTGHSGREQYRHDPKLQPGFHFMHAYGSTPDAGSAQPSAR